MVMCEESDDFATLPSHTVFPVYLFHSPLALGSMHMQLLLLLPPHHHLSSLSVGSM